MPQRRVIIFGATSRVGPAIIEALLSTSSPSSIELTILLRPSSSSPPPYPGVKLKTLPSDTPSFDQLVSALSGYDVLISALGRQTFDLQCQLSDVCVAAKVRRYVLADYGSVSSDDEVATAYLGLYKEKARVRGYAESVAAKPENRGTFSWTSLITGHFFDYGLKTELLGFDLRGKTVDLFDGGEIRWSSSTLPQIGRAVRGIIHNLDDEHKDAQTANRLLYVQSFWHSQLEILAAVERALGEFKRTERSTEQWLAERKEKGKQGDAQAVEEIVEVLGMTRSSWPEDNANALLELEEEDLKVVVKGVVEDWKKARATAAASRSSLCVVC